MSNKARQVPDFTTCSLLEGLLLGCTPGYTCGSGAAESASLQLVMMLCCMLDFNGNSSPIRRCATSVGESVQAQNQMHLTAWVDRNAVCKCCVPLLTRRF
eukprot:jgi/Ulvmu1/2933/UM149_0012.1